VLEGHNANGENRFFVVRVSRLCETDVLVSVFTIMVLAIGIGILR